MHLLLLVSFVGAAAACSGGTGDLAKKATFTFTISPPVEWTYGLADSSMGQAFSEATANTKFQTDVKSAVRQSLPSSVSSTSITYSSWSFTPILATLFPTCNAARTDKAAPLVAALHSYSVYKGALYEACHNQTEPATQVDVRFPGMQGTVQLSSATAFYESQWANIMILVEDKLSSKNVVFKADTKLRLN